MMKNQLTILLCLALGLIGVPCLSQSLPVGFFPDEILRIHQLNGETDAKISFSVRPFLDKNAVLFDSVSQPVRSLLQNSSVIIAGTAGSKKNMQVLSPIFRQQFNTHHPYGWNDGSLVPAKGYQNQLSAGIYANLGPVSIQLRPEFVFAQNAAFSTFWPNHSDAVWKHYYDTVLNQIDAPERFGERAYVRMFPGQSSIRLNLKKLSLGISTENLWWGPGVRNSLLMSNNAPGFPHLTFNTTAPLLSSIGSFEGQLISGLLKNSGFLPQDTNRTVAGRRLYIPKYDDNRYINGMVVTWQPKWTRGLYFGFSRVFYMYQNDLSSSVTSYLPVVGHFFKGSGSDIEREDNKRRDQMVSLFFRLVLPKEKFELYGEFGRNDHSGDTRDFLLEPGHSGAFIAGIKKLVKSTGKRKVELMSEFAHLQMPLTRLVREQQSWYSHHQVRHGYTHKGQIIGAGIGTGSNSQSFGVNWFEGINRTGILLERIVRNNDFYYHAFADQRNYLSHWVDLSLNLNKSWRHKQFLYNANLSFISSFNYQWRQHKDVYHLQAGLSISYLFK